MIKSKTVLRVAGRLIKPLNKLEYRNLGISGGFRKKAAGSTANVRRGAPTVVSETDENAAVESLLMLSRRGVGLTVKMLKQKVAII